MPIHYMTGDGVDNNPVNAAWLCEKAALKGHSKAQVSLGHTYYKGRGRPKDTVAAYSWFLIAGTRTMAVYDRNIMKKARERVAKEGKLDEVSRLVQEWNTGGAARERAMPRLLP